MATPKSKDTPAKKAAPKAAPAKAACAKSACAKPAPAKAKKAATTEFKLNAPNAASVCLTGDFNSWSPTELCCKKAKNGVWSFKVALAPGTYEYLFIVDGQWWTDPENPNRVPNSFGTENSLITIS